MALWRFAFLHMWLLVPPPCSEGDLGQQLSAHLSHLAPGLPSGPLAPPSSFPEILALTFGAVLACVAHFAGTAVGPVAGQAVAAAPTGAREAGVTHCLTVVAEEALWTHAQVGPTTVLTPASVLAGAGGAGIHLCFTVGSNKTFRALADERPGEVPAGASISAGLCLALVCL